jgi:hypothetical protein
MRRTQSKAARRIRKVRKHLVHNQDQEETLAASVEVLEKRFATFGGEPLEDFPVKLIVRLEFRARRVKVPQP